MRSRFVAVALCTWSLCGLLAGCAVQEPNAAPAETPRAEQPTASEGLPQDSVFTRLRDEDGLRRLAQDMKEGKVPTSCIAFYDQGGSSSVVSVTSEDEVQAMYGLAGNVVVRGKVDADAAELAGMITNQNFVPVVDDRNVLMGIVTRKRVMQELFSKGS